MQNPDADLLGIADGREIPRLAIPCVRQDSHPPAVLMSMRYWLPTLTKHRRRLAENTEYNVTPNPSAQRYWELPGLGVPAAATEAGRMRSRNSPAAEVLTLAAAPMLDKA